MRLYHSGAVHAKRAALGAAAERGTALSPVSGTDGCRIRPQSGRIAPIWVVPRSPSSHFGAEFFCVSNHHRKEDSHVSESAHRHALCGA